MISISPISGYKHDTSFVLTVSPSANDIVINWGDQTFSDSPSATHSYSAAGIYDVYAGTCGSTSAFSVSVFNGSYYEKAISIGYDTLSAIAGCPNTLTINLSSDQPQETVFFYSSGSKSYPYSDQSFWSHLNPSWYFSYQDQPVSELVFNLSPVVVDSNIIGYTTASAVDYVDDIPGNPILFFTVKQTEGINSRVYSALTYGVSADRPNKLLVTADGINDIAVTQFTDIEIPYVISVQGLSACNNIMHYASGAVVDWSVTQGCYGIAPSAYTFPLSTIHLKDDNCFYSGGYLRSTLVVPSSAVPLNSRRAIYYEDQCGNPTPEIQEWQANQINPFSISISANALITVGSTQYSISGQSVPFNIYRVEDFHQFYRKGEDKTVYDLIKKYNHFDLEETPTFNNYLSAVAGPGDTLGKVYDKIANFHLDHNDPDLCTVDALVSLGQMLDNPVDDFGLAYPEELRRLINMFSIPVNKLVGTRCVCNTNFVGCQGCVGRNICGLCGFDKKSNLGDQILPDDMIVEDQTILIKENGASTYDFWSVPYTTQLRNLTSIDVSDYCFYQWNATNQNNPVESVIDYHNPETTVSRNLSAQDWIDDDGVMEQLLQKVLVNNLLNT